MDLHKMEKLSITKEEKIMLAYDTKSLLQRAYIHRYKVHSNKGFRQEGLPEVKKLMNIIELLISDFNNLNASTLYYSFNY